MRCEFTYIKPVFNLYMVKKLYHNFINKILHLARFFYFKVLQYQHTTYIHS
jgi:hypothetical protein